MYLLKTDAHISPTFINSKGLASWLYIRASCKCRVIMICIFNAKIAPWCRYLTDQLQKVHVVYEANKVGGAAPSRLLSLRKYLAD
jgi:hypothetical protein